MQSKEERNQKAKIRQRKYRKTHKAEERAYNRKPKRAKAIASRVQARRDMKKTHGSKIKNHDIHHKDGNARNNKKSNLKIVKRYHDGGKKKGK